MNSGQRVNIVVPGRPVPLSRPRFANGRAYTCDKSRAAQADIGAMASPCFHGDIGGDVVVELDFVYDVPKSWPKHKRDKAHGQALRPRYADVDNLAKQVLDGLNGIAYADDMQVVSLFCSKRFAFDDHDAAHTSITVTYR